MKTFKIRKGVHVVIAKDEDGKKLDLRPSKGEDGLNRRLEALENVDGVNPNLKTYNIKKLVKLGTYNSHNPYKKLH